MSTRGMVFRAALVGVFAAGVPGDAVGQVAPAAELIRPSEQYEALTGHTSFVVNIVVSDELKPYLTESTVRATIEARIRQAGLPLVEPSTPSYTGELRMEVSGYKVPGLERVNVNTTLSFVQRVTLLMPNRYMWVATWRVAAHGTLSASAFSGRTREMANEFLDEFINDWFKANPKGGG